MVTKKIVVVIILLIVTFICVQIFSRLETYQTPNLTPESFPQKFKGWIGTDVEVSDVEKNFLPADTLFTKKYYTKPGFGSVFLVVVFSGRDRRSIHRPEVCYPSQGWSIQERTPQKVAVDHPIKTLNTMRLDIAFGKNMYSHSEIVLYWFMGNKRVTSTHFKRVLLMGFDRCVLAKNYRWAFLRVSSPVLDTGEDSTLKVLKKFVSDLFPIIADDSYRQF